MQTLGKASARLLHHAGSLHHLRLPHRSVFHHAMLPHHAVLHHAVLLHHPVFLHHARLHLPAVHLAAVHVVVLGRYIHGDRCTQRDRCCDKQRAGFQLFHVFLHVVCLRLRGICLDYRICNGCPVQTTNTRKPSVYSRRWFLQKPIKNNWTGINTIRLGIDLSESRARGAPAAPWDLMFSFIRKSTRLEDWSSFENEALPHHVDLYRMAKWLIRDRDAAEDLVQETFVAALKSFHRFQKGTNCRAWLIKIMYHTLSKRRRSESRLRLVSDTEEQIAETVAFEPPTPQHLTEQEVLDALERLPQQFQEVVILSDVEDLTYKEIAEALSIPTGTVMSRLHRGRRLLRAELAAYANARGIGAPTDEKQSHLRLTSKQEGGKSNAMS